MIVGAEKSGTTALDHYLATHPRLRTARHVVDGHSLEITYFLEPNRFGATMPWAHWFGPDLSGLLVGKCPVLMYSHDAIARLREHNPGLQVVALLRDPVMRAYSSFLHARLRGLEPLAAFEDAIEAGPTRFPEGDPRRTRCDYLEWSRYADYLPRLFDAFPESQVHVLILEEVIADPRPSVAPLLSSLGLDPGELAPGLPRPNRAGRLRSEAFARAIRPGGTLGRVGRALLPLPTRDWLRVKLVQLNVTEGRPPPLAPGTVASLRSMFAEPNRRLGDLLGGRDLSELWPA